MILPPEFYYRFQAWVHREHRPEYEMLRKYLRWNAGETIWEIGCGSGNLAHHFINDGVRYVGVDVIAERIEFAKKMNPQATFEAANSCEPFPSHLPKPAHAFCHGVLHHLSDEDTMAVLAGAARVIGPNGRFVAIEVALPENPMANPLAYLACKLDDGEYIRKPSAWRKLLMPYITGEDRIDLRPRWPADILAFNLNLGPLSR